MIYSKIEMRVIDHTWESYTWENELPLWAPVVPLGFPCRPTVVVSFGVATVGATTALAAYTLRILSWKRIRTLVWKLKLKT